MLRVRLAAAAAVLVPVLAIFWLDDQWNFGLPGIWLTTIAILIGAGLAAEVSQLAGALTAGPRPLPAVIGTVGVLVATALPYFLEHHLPADCALEHWGWTASALMIALMVIFAWEMVYFRQPGEAVTRVAWTYLVVAYASLGMSFLISLRLAFAPRIGLFAVFSVVAITKFADAVAYFTGKTFGKRRLAPVLSPNKTWAGAVGALVGAAGVALPLLTWLLPWCGGQETVAPPLWAQLLYGISLALAGMLGDLMESLLKRDCQQKDSSHWLPGLGGVLDIFDALLVAGPVGFLWWTTGLLG